MDAFATYIIKSVVWLSGFLLVYFIFLRNERYFQLNRYFLLTGILSAFLLPLVSVYYSVVLPVAENLDSEIVAFSNESNFPVNHSTESFLFILYISGVLLTTILFFRQLFSVRREIRQSEIINYNSVKLIRAARYKSAFSFFSWVFVNPSTTDIETREIVNHEMAHIRQRHWFDLLLLEFLCILQWFNPLVWIYVRFVRQNHEYLADAAALQQTTDPAQYRATLINQIVGSPVLSLSNAFSYSLNKKRFNMMKNIESSPYRKLKVLIILPVIALVLYSFAKPQYLYSEKVTNEAIVLSESELLISDISSYILQDTSRLKRVQEPQRSTGSRVMEVEEPAPPPPPATVSTGVGNSAFPPPPPPPLVNGGIVIRGTGTSLSEPGNPSSVSFRSPNGESPLIVIDGIISKSGYKDLDPNAIKSITLIKGAKAKDKYGIEAKDGAIEITTKK